ncbi:Uncharacterised protein [uncultured archaeon]|nr:Uncharacterised protein [uncultured archaeon]
MTEIRKPKVKVSERPAVKYAASAADKVAKEGEKALKTVAQTQRELGTKYARERIKSCGIKGKDAKAAGAVFMALLSELSVDYNIIEDTSRRFVAHTTECPFLEEWKNTGADASKLCESFGKSFVQGLCDAVNPKLKYTVSRTMSGESSYCEEKIELT